MSSSPYAPAAHLLNEIWSTGKSLKTLAYDNRHSTSKLRCSKATYAQVCHVLESKALLDVVLVQSTRDDGHHQQPKKKDGNKQLNIQSRNKGLLYVLLYELLLGPNKRIRGGGALKRQLMKYEVELRNRIKQLQQHYEKDRSLSSSTYTRDGVIARFPRYVRINTLTNKSTMDVVQQLKDEQSLQTFYCDRHVPDLLVLHPSASSSLHESSLVKDHHVILQDKSSCFSALCLIQGSHQLGPFWKGDCLDACAAPGNKTSHLAMLMQQQQQHHVSPTNEGRQSRKSHYRTVFALDRSERRLTSLKRRMNQLIPVKSKNSHSSDHCTIQVECQHLDFLKTNPKDFSNKLKGILLDPSCSGSGIYTSPDRLVVDDAGEDALQRIQTLSNFQVTALVHAMSFPQVERIVYSTCSIHEEENERVVAQALLKTMEQTNENDWHLVAPQCLSEWTRRGRVIVDDDQSGVNISQEQAKCMIRAERDDETNGFFVAYLERKSAYRNLNKSQSNETDSSSSQGAQCNNNPVKPIAGLEIYNAQFQEKTETIIKHTETAETSDDALTASSTKTDEKEKLRLPSGNSNEQQKAIPRKKAKKLAWKRKQMEQKKQRMKTKSTSL